MIIRINYFKKLSYHYDLYKIVEVFLSDFLGVKNILSKKHNN